MLNVCQSARGLNTPSLSVAICSLLAELQLCCLAQHGFAHSAHYTAGAPQKTLPNSDLLQTWYTILSFLLVTLTPPRALHR